MGTVLGVICAFVFLLAWAACSAAGAYDDWSEYDDLLVDPDFAEGFRGGLTEMEAVELILTEAELLESDAEENEEDEFSWQARRLARAMRMGAEALERSIEC
jgi:hypothetical protein